VTLVRGRWPIEQTYRELTDELGIDNGGARRPIYAPHCPVVRWCVLEILAVRYVVGNRKLLNLMASFQRNPPLRR
jgi:hypothetical protein